MKKNIIKLCIALFPVVAGATGMAVGMENLYLKNNNKSDELILIKNFNADNKVNIPANGMCKINTRIMFLPPEYDVPAENRANYVISVKGNDYENDIVMDKYGISLASDSFIKAPSNGNVKNFSLTGYCGGKYQQFRYLSVNDVESNEIPEFKLANCKNDSNFVYSISSSYVKVLKKPQNIDFSNIPECSLTSEESK